MEKASDDASTIDDAIAAAITAHDADSAAHLGAGGSLAAHKAEGTIDHPPASIVSDKFAANEFILTPSFESIDGYYVLNQVYLSTPAIDLEPTNTGHANRSSLGIFLDGIGIMFDITKEMLLEFSFSNDITEDQICIAQLGTSPYPAIAAPLGFGVSFDSPGASPWGARARFFTTSDDGATVNYSDYFTVPALETHRFRVYNNVALDQVEGWMDGEMVATLSWPDESWSQGAVIKFESEISAGSAGPCTISAPFIAITQ